MYVAASFKVEPNFKVRSAERQVSDDQMIPGYQANVTVNLVRQDDDAVRLPRWAESVQDLMEECASVLEARYVRVEGHMWFDRLAEGGVGDNKRGLRYCEHSMYVRRWQAVSGAEGEDEPQVPTREAQVPGPDWAIARKLLLVSVGVMIGLEKPRTDPESKEQMAELYAKYRDLIFDAWEHAETK